MLNISLNKNLDYETYTNFHDFSIAGADFGAKIKNDHSTITLENHKKYIDDFYLEHEIEITEKQTQINKLLDENKVEFFKAVKEIFDMDITDKNYQGYLSIFNCNPRFINNKTFQVYYKKDLPNTLEVIFHEILHFVFFEYVDNNLSEQTQNLSKNKGPFWELSEITNVIILNLPSFRKLLGREELLFYPELNGKLKIAQHIWDTKEDIRDFVINTLDMLQSSHVRAN